MNTKPFIPTSIDEMPKDVKNNKSCKTYTVLNEQEKVVFQATREDHKDDKPTIIENGIIKFYGIYQGDWVDTTAKAKAEEKNNTKSEPTNKVPIEKDELDELALAEELLKKFRRNGECHTE